jgi:hypothetical protein
MADYGMQCFDRRRVVRGDGLASREAGCGGLAGDAGIQVMRRTDEPLRWPVNLRI